MANKELISLKDFNRIFAAIYTSISNNGFNPHKNCTLFSVAGACILNEFHGIRASSVSGAAAFFFGFEKHLIFSNRNAVGFECSKTGFHSWIQSGDWFIDFTSPLLPEIAAEVGLITDQRSMMQKSLDMEALSFDELSEDKRFMLMPDIAFSEEIAESVLDNKITSKVILDSMKLYSEKVKFKNLELLAVGSW